MEIKREYNEREKYYEFEFIKDNKHLEIFFGGNLDLYMILSTDDLIPHNENITIDFDITKEDYSVFELFDTLYNDIINRNVYLKEELPSWCDKEIGNFDFSYPDYQEINAYNKLVDENKNITWISDDGLPEAEDKLTISKLEDAYRLSFIRNDKELDVGFKSPYSIVVRFRNSGSWYDPFNVVFMKMYHKLQQLDLDYHQYHIEEYLYTRKLKR